MNSSNSKTEFIQKCFRDLLDDGQPHRYREILDYTRQQAVGTEFEGTIEQNNVVIAFGQHLNDPDSPYGRVRHGVYQKIPHSVLQDQQLNKQLTALHRFLDQAVALQEQMGEAYAGCKDNWPDSSERFSAFWKSADKAVDETIDCLAAWIAETEDFDMELQGQQQTSPMMQM